jgi:hypothetical protein
MLTRRWKTAGSTRTIWGLFAVAVILMCLTSTGFAQSTTSEGPSDAYYLGYYGNANMGFPTAEVNIVNPGSTGGYSVFDPTAPGPYGDLCANIYVFTSDQEMVECCSCFISPNGLRTLNIDVDLTSNPLTSTPPHTGLIKIVSSTIDPSQGDGACAGVSTNPAGKSEFTDEAGVPYGPEGSLRTWDTHVRATTSSLFTLTETSFRHADIGQVEYGAETRDGSSELRKLQQGCHNIALNGSGHGHCTCGTGD